MNQMNGTSQNGVIPRTKHVQVGEREEWEVNIEYEEMNNRSYKKDGVYSQG